MKFKLFILLVLFTAAGGGYWYFFMNGNGEKKKTVTTLDRHYEVKRGELVVGLFLSGNISAKKKYKLSLEAPVKTTLIWVVDEGEEVKKGDVVLKFEKEDLIQKIDDLKVKIDFQEKSLAIAREERVILVTSNEASLRAAEDSVVSNTGAYNKYWKLEGPKLKDSQNLSVSQSEAAYEKAKQDYVDEYNKFNNTVFSDQKSKDAALKKLEVFKQDREKKETEYNNAILDKKIFKRYTYPNKITDLLNTLEQAKLNLKKEKVRTASSLIQKDAAIIRMETELRQLKKDLGKNESWLPMMEIKAPVDGVVIYGDPGRRHYKTDIKVGMGVQRKQTLLTIPDMSEMMVDFDIPEQYRAKVEVGTSVVVTPDSRPDLKQEGTISKIAFLPVNQVYWDSNSPKLYRSQIALEKQDRELVSGMTVRLEVISKRLKDVLFIPVEAVIEESGEFFVYKQKLGGPKKFPIEIGNSNDKFVEVVKGIKEGDKICLYRPFQDKSSEKK